MITAKWTGRATGSNRRLETNRYGHIYSSKAYKGFKKGLAWAIASARHHVIYLGHVRVDIDYLIAAARDIDSLTKPVLDAIQLSGLIRNDNMVVKLYQRKRAKARGADDEIEVTIMEVAE